MTSLPEERLAQAAKLYSGLNLAAPEVVKSEALMVLTCSDFVGRFARRHELWFSQFIQAQTFEKAAELTKLNVELDEHLQGVIDQDDLMHRLRLFRNQKMVHIVWRHIARRSDLEETVSYLSTLADVCIDRTLDYLETWLVSQWGVPVDENQRHIKMSVLALGKLGGGELNLSSDVDLILGYSDTGVTSGNKTSEQFFVRLSQQLIKVLNDVTVEGFVFRVDMRLRPFGDSGALALPFAVIEDYYSEHGRDWERYAFIKARICAGDRESGAQLLKALKPFVYRRYLDFGAFDSLRQMQTNIVQARRVTDRDRDIKLGAGGIRDMEFMVQAQQLVWGGQKPLLQTRGFIESLDKLMRLQIINKEEGALLETSYRFLRDIEHSLQAFDDQQTQTLPSSAIDQSRLAAIYACSDYQELETKITLVREKVSRLFSQSLGQDSNESADKTPWYELGESEEAKKLLVDLYREQQKTSVSEEAKKRLDALVPKLLDSVFETKNPLETLRRVQKILRSIMRRSAYFSLLSENAGARIRFVDAVAESQWIVQRLAITPNLFDCLLDPELETEPPTLEHLEHEIESILWRLKSAGEEAQLTAISDFKEFHVFRVAVAEVLGSLPLMRISDYLTFVAEAVIRVAVDLALEKTLFEFPQQQETELIVVAYGKLGGIELGPNSDLDLVFIHDMPMESAPFLQRLSRRILHILTLRTAHGPMYEIDVRLRPTGRAGTMMTSIDSFERYQESSAWVWEHQSLVRARVVAGSSDLSAKFRQVRGAILVRPRQKAELANEIVSMRNKMRRHQKETGLKQASGGIVDIEFMVQYLVLAWAEKFPSLGEFSDNVRIIAEAERLELLTSQDSKTLTRAYLALRSESHRMIFNQPDSDRERQVLNEHSGAVQDLFYRLTGSVE